MYLSAAHKKIIDSIPYLSDCLDLDSPFTPLYLDVISCPDVDYEHKHHIVPAAYFERVLNVEARKYGKDMDACNLVPLSKKSHTLAHFYLAQAINEKHKLVKAAERIAYCGMWSDNKDLFNDDNARNLLASFAKSCKYANIPKNPFRIKKLSGLPSNVKNYREFIYKSRDQAAVTYSIDNHQFKFYFDDLGNCISVRIENVAEISCWRNNDDGVLAQFQIMRYGYNCFAEIAVNFGTNPQFCQSNASVTFPHIHSGYPGYTGYKEFVMLLPYAVQILSPIELHNVMCALFPDKEFNPICNYPFIPNVPSRLPLRKPIVTCLSDVSTYPKETFTEKLGFWRRLWAKLA